MSLPASSTLCVVYSYDSEGVRMPERPTSRLAPSRGARVKPPPRELTYEPPTPRPAKPNIVRVNGRWYDGSTSAENTVASSSPALTFETPRMPDSWKLSARNQPID